MQRIFDEFEARQRAGGNRLVGIDDEGIGERRHRLKLRRPLFWCRLDRLQLRFRGVTGEIVEFVAQQIAAAREFVLRDLRALALDLEDVGKNLGEGRNSRPRRVIWSRRAGFVVLFID